MLLSQWIIGPLPPACAVGDVSKESENIAKSTTGSNSSARTFSPSLVAHLFRTTSLTFLLFDRSDCIGYSSVSHVDQIYALHPLFVGTKRLSITIANTTNENAKWNESSNTGCPLLLR